MGDLLWNKAQEFLDAILQLRNVLSNRLDRIVWHEIDSAVKKIFQL
jgi:hypothetical protein